MEAKRFAVGIAAVLLASPASAGDILLSCLETHSTYEAGGRLEKATVHLGYVIVFDVSKSEGLAELDYPFMCESLEVPYVLNGREMVLSCEGSQEYGTITRTIDRITGRVWTRFSNLSLVYQGYCERMTEPVF